VAGTEPCFVGGSARKATHYVLKIDIGGIAGFVAPLVGKQPPDSQVWILDGERCKAASASLRGHRITCSFPRFDAAL
jgi:hypothetical protein